MRWDSLASFFAMGGYAPFVWPAFGLAAAVLLGLLIASLRRLRAAKAELAAAESVGHRRRDRR
jgi:heme exporter protein D